jgi:hypothetical protein
MDASCELLQKLLSQSPLSRRLSGSATTVIRIIMATRHYTMQVGNPYRPLPTHVAILRTAGETQYKISKIKLSISMIAVTPATESTKASLAGHTRKLAMEVAACLFSAFTILSSAWSPPCCMWLSTISHQIAVTHLR